MTAQADKYDSRERSKLPFAPAFLSNGFYRDLPGDRAREEVWPAVTRVTEEARRDAAPGREQHLWAPAQLHARMLPAPALQKQHSSDKRDEGPSCSPLSPPAGGPLRGGARGDIFQMKAGAGLSRPPSQNTVYLRGARTPPTPYEGVPSDRLQQRRVLKGHEERGGHLVDIHVCGDEQVKLHHDTAVGDACHLHLDPAGVHEPKHGGWQGSPHL